MSDISLSKTVRSNLLALKGTADMMAVAQNRLSTGNKVNSAIDAPSNWFTAQGLTNRSSDLNALMDSMASGIQTLKTADNGLTAMTKTLESMQSTLRQARQDKSFQMTSYDLSDNRSGDLTVSGGALTAPVELDLHQTTGGTPALVSGASSYVSAAPAAATTPVLTAASAFTPLDVTGGKTYSIMINDGVTDAVYDFSTASTDTNLDGSVDLAETITRLNALLAANTSDFRVRDNAGGLEFYDTTGTTGSANMIRLHSFNAPLGGSPQSNFGFGGILNDAAYGLDAIAYSFSVGDGTDNQTISLDHTNAATLTSAVTRANTLLGSGNIFEAFDDAGTLSFREKETNGVTLYIAGATAGPLFGATAVSNTGTPPPLKTTDVLVSEINEHATLAGALRASNDNGRLRIENQSTQVLEIANTTNGAITGSSGSVSQIAGNSVRTTLASQFNELRDQLDKLSDDASFNGINLLRGDNLKIAFNETGTSSINILAKDGQSINSANLGVPTSLQAEQLDSDASIDVLLADMKIALDSVRTQSSSFGSNLSIVQNRQDFTKAMIDTLETGAGNLTLADMNEEAASLLALQTRQQLSSNSLSLASQADQSILQLLR
jgi:flagellin